jgi:hypothetical protein
MVLCSRFVSMLLRYIQSCDMELADVVHFVPLYFQV